MDQSHSSQPSTSELESYRYASWKYAPEALATFTDVLAKWHHQRGRGFQTAHRVPRRLAASPENPPTPARRSRFTQEQLDEIRSRAQSLNWPFETNRTLGEEYGISASTVSLIKHGRYRGR